MTDKQPINYYRIEKAISYITTHIKDQPTLDAIAKAVGISPHHFQRMFIAWAGVSPKKFTQYLNLQYAKALLTKEDSNLLDTSYEVGLSGTSRLHDLFIKIEGMTPGEYKNGGKGLTINYSFANSPFGQVIVASTRQGICHIAFDNDEAKSLSNLTKRFPHAQYYPVIDQFQQHALAIFQDNKKPSNQLTLHLNGTAFQLKVWEALLKIPMGALTTYGTIAKSINSPKASRAVGTAVGSNPVALLIPCHRVIQKSGLIGGYMWGTTRKSAIIGWEAAKINS